MLLRSVDLPICGQRIAGPQLARWQPSIKIIVGRRGSAVDALVVALAAPGGTVITADLKDLKPLAAHAENVAVERV